MSKNTVSSKQMIKKQTAFRFSPELLTLLKKGARRENRSLNNYVETLLASILKTEPNIQTKSSIKEARNTSSLERIKDIDSFFNTL